MSDCPYCDHGCADCDPYEPDYDAIQADRDATDWDAGEPVRWGGVEVTDTGIHTPM